MCFWGQKSAEKNSPVCTPYLNEATANAEGVEFE
jgi:hypothetical protein